MERLVVRIEAAVRAVLAWAEGAAPRRAAIITAVALCVLVPGLATLPPTDRDESRYVVAARQMVETGDLVDIRFQDEPRWNKPAGIYWAQAAVAAVTGGSDAPIWAYRLPSAVGILAAALLTAWALTPLLGGNAALIAGLMVATSVLAAVEGHIAKTDAALLATIVAAEGALVRIWLAPRPGFGRDRLVFWAALGIGVLVKGPIALLAIAGPIGWIAVAERSLALPRRLGWGWGVAILGAIVLPWLVAIAIASDGAFFAESLGRDFLGKVATGAERHGAPPGYYLATIWGTFWPWAPLALFAAPFLWRVRRSPALRFLLGASLPIWALYEIGVATKLPHYMLPILPALAGLIAHWIVSPQEPRPGRARTALAVALFGVVGAGLATAALAGTPLVEGRIGWGGAILGTAGLAVTVLGAWALARLRVTAFLGIAPLAAILLYAAMFAATLPGLATAFPSPRMAAAHATLGACSDRPLVSVGYFEPSLVVAAGTRTRRADAAEAAALLRDEDGWSVFFEVRDDRPLDGFTDLVEAPVAVIAVIEGFNYNRGRSTRLVLVARADDPRLAPCLAARAGGSP